MKAYKIFPTIWPLLQLEITIWKLSLRILSFRPSMESMTYEYLVLLILWGNKEWRFRLYDTMERFEDRLASKLNRGTDYTLEQLEEIRDIAIKEIEKKK